MKSRTTQPTYVLLFSLITLLSTGSVSAQMANTDIAMTEVDPVETIIQIGGETQLIDGKAVINIDPEWAKTYSEVDYNYQIMVMPEGDTPAMFISNKSMDGFTVTQLGPKADDSGFSWTLIATPKPTEGGPTITKAIHTHSVPAPRIVRNFEQIN